MLLHLIVEVLDPLKAFSNAVHDTAGVLDDQRT
jgi:hypothetical protein